MVENNIKAEGPEAEVCLSLFSVFAYWQPDMLITENGFVQNPPKPQVCVPDLVLTNCEDEEPPSEVKSHADEEKLKSTEVYARVRWSPAICFLSWSPS